jgi:hypothetical protein
MGGGGRKCLIIELWREIQNAFCSGPYHIGKNIVREPLVQIGQFMPCWIAESFSYPVI